MDEKSTEALAYRRNSVECQGVSVLHTSKGYYSAAHEGIVNGFWLVFLLQHLVPGLHYLQLGTYLIPAWLFPKHKKYSAISFDMYGPPR